MQHPETGSCAIKIHREPSQLAGIARSLGWERDRQKDRQKTQTPGGGEGTAQTEILGKSSLPTRPKIRKPTLPSCASLVLGQTS